MNVLTNPESLSETFRMLGQPIRLQIILIIAKDRACVCHLEAVLGIRQAVISQHLIVLRKAGLVATQREGRHIYYLLSHPELYDTVCQVARELGFVQDEIAALAARPVKGCSCPLCNPELDPKLTCKKSEK